VLIDVAPWSADNIPVLEFDSAYPGSNEFRFVFLAFVQSRCSSLGEGRVTSRHASVDPELCIAQLAELR